MNDYYTSIQYQLTNNKIFDDVFAHADEFSKILFAGPESLKKYLVEQWESIRADFKNKNFQNVVDIDRPVTESNFVVTGYKISEDIRSYIMAFLVSSRPDVSCEVIALTVVKGRPRYFTIEASEQANLDRKKPWIIQGFVRSTRRFLSFGSPSAMAGLLPLN